MYLLIQQFSINFACKEPQEIRNAHKIIYITWEKLCTNNLIINLFLYNIIIKYKGNEPSTNSHLISFLTMKQNMSVIKINTINQKLYNILIQSRYIHGTSRLLLLIPGAPWNIVWEPLHSYIIYIIRHAINITCNCVSFKTQHCELSLVYANN